MVVQIGIIAFVVNESYVGREDVVKASQRGCERSKLDREANATGWRAAETARLNTLAKSRHISFTQAWKLIWRKPSLTDSPDLVAARTYDKIASGQEARSRISCAKAFPKASLLP